MKKFIVHLVYFTIALLVFLMIVDGVVTYLYHQKDTRKYAVWNDILHKDINADVLIMGSSRGWCQYSTDILDSILGVNSYNLGFDGSCFNRQKVRFDIYRHYQRRKPDYIIQNVDFSTLGSTIGYEHEQFLPYMMYSYFRDCVIKVEPFTMGELYIPMYRYYVNNVYEDYTKYDYVVRKGYYAENIVWDGTVIKALQPFKVNVDSTTLRTFSKYIMELQQDEIKLIFVFAPVYVDGINKVQNIAEVHKIYYDLSEKYNIPILDYTNCEISQDTSYFYNATHLNKNGAELFSSKLAHDLKENGLILNKKGK